MTQYIPVIQFAKKVKQQIDWFTRNWKNEIGAIGLGEVKDGIMYVERLVFPTQIVNGAHVHFEPKDWGEIVKRLSFEELSKIIFYWHRHPDGMPGASQGDEETTFDVFMCEEAERKIFGFMQSAKKIGSNEIEYEARIEIRDPIIASWVGVKITTDEDESIEEECLKIIKKYVTIGHKTKADQPGFKKQTRTYDKMGEKYNVNDMGTSTVDDYKKPYDGFIFRISKVNGDLNIVVNTWLEGMVLDILDAADCKNLFRKYLVDPVDNSTILISVMPRKKQLKHIEAKIQKFKEEMEHNLQGQHSPETLTLEDMTDDVEIEYEDEEEESGLSPAQYDWYKSNEQALGNYLR